MSWDQDSGKSFLVSEVCPGPNFQQREATGGWYFCGLTGCRSSVPFAEFERVWQNSERKGHELKHEVQWNYLQMGQHVCCTEHAESGRGEGGPVEPDTLQEVKTRMQTYWKTPYSVNSD